MVKTSEAEANAARAVKSLPATLVDPRAVSDNAALATQIVEEAKEMAARALASAASAAAAQARESSKSQVETTPPAVVQPSRAAPAAAASLAGDSAAQADDALIKELDKTFVYMHEQIQSWEAAKQVHGAGAAAPASVALAAGKQQPPLKK